MAEFLRQLHDQSRDRNTAGRAQELGLFGLVNFDRRRAHHAVWIFRPIVDIERGEVNIQLLDLVLQHDLVAGDLLAFAGVVVLALSVDPFARTATRESSVAFRLALGNRLGQHATYWSACDAILAIPFCSAYRRSRCALHGSRTTTSLHGYGQVASMILSAAWLLSSSRHAQRDEQW